MSRADRWSYAEEEFVRIAKGKSRGGSGQYRRQFRQLLRDALTEDTPSVERHLRILRARRDRAASPASKALAAHVFVLESVLGEREIASTEAAEATA